MNIQRAEEIVASPTLIKVTYNGVLVYIQNVDNRTKTARIYPLDEPANEQDVPLESLKEH